jgi:LysM repeat protein
MAEERYTVKPGDTLSGISKSFGVTIEDLKKANGLVGDAIKAKQVLTLPRMEKGEGVEEAEEVGDSEEPTGEQLAGREDEKQEGSGSVRKWNGSEERNLFVRVVKTFLGVPYRLGGSTLKGIDCSAFVKKIYHIFNIDLPRTAREQFLFGRGVKRDELEEGDLVFFSTRRTHNPHVGIYIGSNEFVHASFRNKEVKVDNLDLPYFNKRFLRGVRVKELERGT